MYAKRRFRNESEGKAAGYLLGIEINNIVRQIGDFQQRACPAERKMDREVGKVNDIDPDIAEQLWRDTNSGIYDSAASFFGRLHNLETAIKRLQGRVDHLKNVLDYAISLRTQRRRPR